MLNFLLKKTIKRIAVKVATDKSLRDKLKTSVHKAHELNSKGELLKTLGKAAGRLKSKIK